MPQRGLAHRADGSPSPVRSGMGFPRFRGHRSGVHRGYCMGSDARLLVVDWTNVADR